MVGGGLQEIPDATVVGNMVGTKAVMSPAMVGGNWDGSLGRAESLLYRNKAFIEVGDSGNNMPLARVFLRARTRPVCWVSEY